MLSPRLESILVSAILALVIVMIALGAEHHLAVVS
jgi:hypothetical protein